MDPAAHQELFEVEEIHWWYLGLRHLVSLALDRFAPDLAEGLALDAGCGTGGWMKHLASKRPGLTVVGLDLAPAGLAGCCQKLTCPLLVRGSVNELPFLADQFDLVFSLDVIYHQNVDDAKAVAEMARVLKTGGLLLLNTPAFRSLSGSHDKAVQGIRRHTRTGLERLLKSVGLRPVHLTYWNSLLLPVMAARRWLSRGRGESDLALPPGPVNKALAGLMKLEVALGLRLSWPVGGSLFAVAEK